LRRLTRVKVISVLAVALVLTAFGASGAFAWGVTISAEADCHTVTVTAHDTDGSFRAHPTGELDFISAKGKLVKENYEFDTENPDTDQVIAEVDANDLGVGDWVVVLKADSTVKAKFKIKPCESPSPTATAQPTETPVPSESPRPSATASPEATASASPSASAQASSSALPSPPVTGAGSGSGGDGTFGIVLLVMVLGTVGIGGTTLRYFTYLIG
jgi:hypothetical protein